MAIYFFNGLLLRTIEITLESVVKFLVACLVSEILLDKDMTMRLAARHLGYSFDVTTRVNFVFFKEHIGKMCKVENSWICIFIYFLHKLKSFRKISGGFT